jgi:hypothetical protein
MLPLPDVVLSHQYDGRLQVRTAMSCCDVVWPMSGDPALQVNSLARCVIGRTAAAGKQVGGNVSRYGESGSLMRIAANRTGKRRMVIDS